jgi:hypothetical protein
VKYLVLAILLLSVPAVAQAPGLAAEDSVRTDDMVVRRVRDGSNGVVCYAVSSYAYQAVPHGREPYFTNNPLIAA